MRAVGYLYHPDYLLHSAPDYHPESPLRLEAIDRHLEQSGLKAKLTAIQPRSATREEILLNHSEQLYDLVRRSEGSGIGHLDLDTYVCAQSFHAACLAVGGVLTAGELVMTGRLASAFCAVRPPGHHAEHDRAMGFCLFNNIAILARHLLGKFGLARIAILDWDVHHGNGTQHAFYSDPRVHFTSLHQYPFYPGTGAAAERGEGAGVGFTLNFPFDYGAGDGEYSQAVCDTWKAEMERFKPEIVLISAGFDAHRDDPLAGLDVTEHGFEEITRGARLVADRFAAGRIVSVLEGGYNLTALAESVTVHIQTLLE